MQIGKWKITFKDCIWFIVCLIIIIAFIAGLIQTNKEGAADVISGASTVVSIVLSLVAILYTMIEGANSNAVNQDTIKSLTEIDTRMGNIINKLDELKDVESRIKYVLPSLISQAHAIENVPAKEGVPPIDPKVAEQLKYLQNYFVQDASE